MKDHGVVNVAERGGQKEFAVDEVRFRHTGNGRAKKKTNTQTHKDTKQKRAKRDFANDESVARVLARVSRNGCIDSMLPTQS